MSTAPLACVSVVCVCVRELFHSARAPPARSVPIIGSSKLKETLEVAIGMRVMILINLSTQAEVANGTRGTVEDIVLDPREPEIIPTEKGRVFLHYPPALVVF